jgi:ABC-2 type transport system permease protein/lipopolysaccharide transport system permease protein
MVLGFTWNLLGPLMLTLVITLVLNKAKVQPPGGVPRPVWIYTAMMPWTFFAGAVATGGVALVANNSLLNKVYVPREVFPISAIMNQIVDTTCASSAFIVILVLNNFNITWSTVYWAPLMLLLALIFTTAVTIVISGFTVYFRDLRQAIPVLLQLGLFVNPVAWDLSQISAQWRPLLCAIDPLAAAIDGLRQCLLYGNAPNFGLSAIGFVVASAELFFGYIIFKQMEAGFADVA